MLKKLLVDWIHDPKNHDQESKGKNSFLKTGKYEQTRLEAVGISNPALKKGASSVYQQIKKQFLQDVIVDISSIMTESKIYEEQLFAVYILEKFKKQFDKSIFKIIDSWIDHIDYWAISDHLAINLFGHFPLENQWYRDQLFLWLESDHYWRRRQALTAYLVRARTHVELLTPILVTIERLLPEDNYYIKKAIPWIMRESYRKHPENHDKIYDFLQKHMRYFSKTMLRESMRYLDNKQQEKLLQQYETM